jgi:hypothetical protein
VIAGSASLPDDIRSSDVRGGIDVVFEADWLYDWEAEEDEKKAAITVSRMMWEGILTEKAGVGVGGGAIFGL